MSFPLLTVLSAAPGILSAAADLVRMARSRQSSRTGGAPADLEKQVAELKSIVAEQSALIEKLAKSNQDMAIAVRNGRILSVAALLAGLGGIAAGLAS
jgi:hypothetical protein